ncbi:hypothetical protein D5F01_LYC11157 [Larimichthys crocea]|uniref:Uncharacterized protein n=1 Tax=Larimichthys crocea TaxID=215358 RepID=A0A6G0IE33_LARCR|nr:hypothetical protein D5F01_LYC11157 [Larimichthys crocea]
MDPLKKVFRAVASYFRGKSRGSKLKDIVLGTSMSTLLSRGKLAWPRPVILYVGQAISFLEYFRATPPKHSRITSGQTKVVIQERKLYKDLGRTVKQGKGLKLVPKEDLARCQVLAQAKIPSLLRNAFKSYCSLFSLTLVSEDIEKAPPRDPKTRYRLFGYLAAYLSSRYGHRTGVLTRMRVKEDAWFTPGRAHKPATGYLEERLRNVRKRNLKAAG